MSEYFLEEAKELIADNEGYRTHMYKCPAGKNTIGIGHNLDANPIPKEAVDIIFHDDIKHVMEDLDTHFQWWREKPHNVKVMLLDFVFNVGITVALNFKNTMKMIETDDFQGASVNLLKSRYAEQVPRRAKYNSELLRNAKKETDV